MTDGAAPGFAKDIRPMFTDMDVDHMKPAGIDLSDPRRRRKTCGRDL